jgi:hypothetical protein
MVSVPSCTGSAKVKILIHFAKEQDLIQIQIHSAFMYGNMSGNFSQKLPSVSILVTNFLFHFSISKSLKKW